jgi:hypothetical protein
MKRTRGPASRSAAGTILAIALALPPSFAQDPVALSAPDAGDRALESFLREAEVVDIVDIGEGITKPRRVTLKDGPRIARAIFKTHDEVSIDPAFTSMAESTFSDRYVYEVAAYRLDRLMGIGLVPVTVTREIDGETGSVQFWVEDAISLQEAMDTGVGTRDVERFLDRKIRMHVLDALIYNIDRNPTNILVTPADDGFWLIDHSRSFRLAKSLPPWGNDWSLPMPPDLRARLELLDQAAVDAVLDGLVDKRYRKVILKRRDAILKEVDRLARKAARDAGG